MCNSAFHEISEEVRKEIGLPESKRVFPLMQNWMKKEVKNIIKRGKV